MITIHERQALANWWTHNKDNPEAIAEKLRAGPYTLKHLAFALGEKPKDMAARLRGHGLHEDLLKHDMD